MIKWIKEHKSFLIFLFIFCLLCLIFYLAYTPYILQKLGTLSTDQVTVTQTTIYYLQLCVGFLLWIGALYIAYKQIKLSKEQWKTIDKQMEFSFYIYNISKARYELDKLTNNLDTNILQYIAWSITMHFDSNEQIRNITKEKLKKVDVGIWEVNKTIDNAIRAYKDALDDKPGRLEFKSNIK